MECCIYLLIKDMSVYVGINVCVCVCVCVFESRVLFIRIETTGQGHGGFSAIDFCPLSHPVE